VRQKTSYDSGKSFVAIKDSWAMFTTIVEERKLRESIRR